MSHDDDRKDMNDQNEGRSLTSNSSTAPVVRKASPRPPIVYSSFGAFWASVWERWRSVWTKQFILALLAGQVLSLCITCTNVTTTELVNRGWTLSTTQGFFLYFAIFLIYTPYTIYQYGFKGWANVVLRDGWKYAILGVCDMEGNFLVVKAYQYTDLLSCMLLDAQDTIGLKFWAFLICIGGLGLLVVSDFVTDKNYPALDRAKGDGIRCQLQAQRSTASVGVDLALQFSIIEGALFAANATEEFFVRKRPLYEVVGQLGMWGFIWNGIQASALEARQMKEVPWNAGIIGLLMAYTAAMVILYTIAPMLYRLASSAFFNLSLLSSDFFGLLFGLFLYHYHPYWLYFVSFVVIICGLITYFWNSTPEEQGGRILAPEAPPYITKRGESGASDEEQPVAATLPNVPDYGAASNDDDGRK
ncbi:hypothetical protein NP233_g7852 [Leucocoprinus birnbaumii]|uniref:DUF914-domain-containing protein n=1 Tax=Leucocoprinus birnbaumii TaxID=56174 RepID=A0AAD5VNI7_9AGAR|nr:hypothetical protein NP233_g7852 [Leucocoprinus birnbaumii]